MAAPSPGSHPPGVAVAPVTGPSRPGGAVAWLRPARRGALHVAAPSPGPDLWRLRLRAPTDPASPSPLSPGSERWWLRLLAHTGRHPLACPNGTDARGQSHHPSCMSVQHQRPRAKSPPCCISVRHRRPWAMSTPKYRTVPRKIGFVFSQLSLGPMASQLLLQDSAGRPDSYNTKTSQHNFMCRHCRAPSTAVDDSLWHCADIGSSLTACTLKK